MILGISCGGRANGLTAQMVKSILEETGMETEFISLAGKTVGGCRGCLKCAVGDGICRYKDDFNEIAEKMKRADAIVFGSPSYTFNISALGHAMLERTYSLRHSRWYLAGKLAVIVSPEEAGNPAEEYIEKMLKHNRMAIVTKVSGETSMPPCYHCGYGKDCYAGWVVKDNDGEPVDEVTEEFEAKNRPTFRTSERIQQNCKAAGWMLRKVLTKEPND